jgi:hypothetical protein
VGSWAFAHSCELQTHHCSGLLFQISQGSMGSLSSFGGSSLPCAIRIAFILGGPEHHGAGWSPVEIAVGCDQPYGGAYSTQPCSMAQCPQSLCSSHLCSEALGKDPTLRFSLSKESETKLSSSDERVWCSSKSVQGNPHSKRSLDSPEALQLISRGVGGGIDLNPVLSHSRSIVLAPVSSLWPLMFHFSCLSPVWKSGRSYLHFIDNGRVLLGLSAVNLSDLALRKPWDPSSKTW